ncbi:MAG: tRNA (guanosine(46)-N7)-methyltransferase TrmB [Methylacidiphilales bacterium]|nr:tRNA (guanosine(46)-N7)-methyltransferase TrmB [Candidatus Methylacidiphilales bacterium]
MVSVSQRYPRRKGRLSNEKVKAYSEAKISDFYFTSIASAIQNKKLWNPLQIEIGFGSGENLIYSAEQLPSQCHVGIELYISGIASLITKKNQNQLTNLVVVQEDALEAMQQVPDQYVSRINIFFPDPWPKKRHHKRRLLSEAFISSCYRTLALGGLLHIATDDRDYFGHALQCISISSASKGRLLHDLPAFWISRVESKFSKRAQREEREIKECFLIKQ